MTKILELLLVVDAERHKRISTSAVNTTLEAIVADIERLRVLLALPRPSNVGGRAAAERVARREVEGLASPLLEALGEEVAAEPAARRQAIEDGLDLVGGRVPGRPQPPALGQPVAELAEPRLALAS